MIQFTATSANGAVLGLGLSFGNLEQIQAGEPAVVELTKHGSTGRIVLAWAAGEEELAGLIELFPADHVVGLTGRTVDTLRSGEAVELALSQLGVPGFWAGILFVGPTEFEIVEALRTSGFLDAAVQLQGLEEYLRHERNEDETCTLCRKRSHRRSGHHPAKSTQSSLRWRDKLYEHPYLAAFGLLGLFALIGLAASLILGPVH